MQPRTRIRWLTGLVLAFAVTLVGVLVFHEAPSDRPRATVAIDAAQRGPLPAVDAETVKAFEKLEAERRLRDQTIWSAEVEALNHGEWLVELWDRLRRGGPEAPVLDAISASRFVLPTDADWASSVDGPFGSRWIEAGPQRVTWNVDRWREGLARWRKEGWRLAQSEWRHVKFQQATERSPASSEVEAELHLSRAENGQLERAALSARIGILWREGRTPGAFAEPDEISILSATVCRRSGEAPFQVRIDQDVTIAGPRKDHRLLVEDLNGDGLPEILLPAVGKIWWNQGAFRFREGSILRGAAKMLSGAVTLCDFDRDGAMDLIEANSDGVRFFRGLGAGGFEAEGSWLWTAPRRVENPFVLACGDADGDGDLDFWLAQYKPPVVGGQMPFPHHDADDGFPSYLLENTGGGQLVDATEKAGLSRLRHRRTYSASFVDLDGDRRPDLWVVSDFAGADVHRNLGGGMFETMPQSWLGDAKGFGMAHAVADLNHDGRLDFWMTGMNSDAAERLDALGLVDPRFPEDRVMRPRLSFGNRLFLGTAGALKQASSAEMGALRKTGWSWGTTTFDADEDGRLEVAVVNGHISRGSVADYDSEFWRHDIHEGSSVQSKAVELSLSAAIGRWAKRGGSYGGHQCNRLLSLDAQGRWRDVSWVGGFALNEDSRNLVSADFDGDGRIDLALTTQEVGAEFRQRLVIFENRLPRRHWLGVRLRPEPGGPALTGCTVRLVEENGREQVRAIIQGDSYLSQHPAAAHFGLGTGRGVKVVELDFADGTRRIFEKPSLDAWLTARK